MGARKPLQAAIAPMFPIAAHPAGPFYIHFWAPNFKWALSFNNLIDLSTRRKNQHFDEQCTYSHRMPLHAMVVRHHTCELQPLLRELGFGLFVRLPLGPKVEMGVRGQAKAMSVSLFGTRIKLRFVRQHCSRTNIVFI